MNRFVMGDIHGAHKALVQCLERSGFNKSKDQLIQLGDVTDGWSEVYECVEELLTIKDLIAIKGNHDEWFNTFIKFNSHGTDWQQGGDATLKSYCKNLDKLYYNKMSGGYTTSLLDTDIPESHREFFKKQILHYIDENNRCFVHGGFNRHIFFVEHAPHVFYWDRDLWLSALSYNSMNKEEKEKHDFKMRENFNEVFIGHTTTGMWGTDKPMKAANIYNLDTGAGFEGKLTIMNIDTKEYFQSDKVTELYKNERGRN